MEDTHSSQDYSSLKLFIGVSWFISLIIAVYIGFSLGQGSGTPQSSKGNDVLTAATIEGTATPTITNAISVAATNIPSQEPQTTVTNKACSKSGFAQKWEYLTPYIIKENDSLQGIAQEQLKDSTRVNEILQINGVGPLVLGSTLYLPPPSVTKSSGNLKQLYGKLVEKNNTSWHLSFSSDATGQVIFIPSFLFEDIPNKDSYKIGDCLKVFLDDGFKVFSLSLQ